MKKLKHSLSLILCFSFLFGFCLVSQVVNAGTNSSFVDISAHWAEKVITDWVELGLISGYPDGTFRPDQEITRAEFIALVNRAFGYKTTTAYNFSDVKPDDWFAAEIGKAQVQGYIGGYPDGTVKPNNPITRQEVASILVKILEPKRTQLNLSAKFIDSDAIPEWSRAAINDIVNLNYMGGYPDSTFRPTRPITRAESLSVLDRVIGKAYYESGIYEEKKVTGNLTITNSGITLKDTIITGDLYLTEGIGTGDVSLDNVQVLGLTYVNGGGTNSILVKDSKLGAVRIKAPQQVRLVAQGLTTISSVDAKTGAKLEERDLTGTGFKEVFVNTLPNSKMELIGNFDQVNVAAPQIKLELSQGSIQKIILAKESHGTNLILAPKTKVDTFVAHSTAKVTGEGTIHTADINVNGVELAQEPT